MKIKCVTYSMLAGVVWCTLSSCNTWVGQATSKFVGVTGMTSGVNSIPLDTLGEGYIKKVRSKYISKTVEEVLDDNEIITEDLADDLILIIDYNYLNYEGGIIAGKGRRGMLFDTSSLVLSSVSAASGTKSTKTLLSTLSSGLQATQTNFDKHYFADQSVDFIIKRMRALRKEVLSEIRQRLNNSEKTYSKRALLIDLLKYYRAGTVSSAAQDILDKAAEETKRKNDKAESKIKEINGISEEEDS